MTGRPLWIGLLFAASLLTSSAAEGQRVAVSYAPSFLTAVTQVVNLTTGVVESSEPRLTVGAPVFTSDGQFLLLRTSPVPATTPILEMRDLVTGFRTSINTEFVPRRAHPRRLAVYGFGPGGGVGRLDSTGLRTYSSCNGSSPIQVELTVDGSRLLVLCQSGDVEAIDEASGTTVHTIVAATSPGAFGINSNFAVNADGSQVLVSRSLAGGGTELVLFDVATGSAILATPVPGPPPPPPYSGPGGSQIVAVTPRRDAVVVTTQWFYIMAGPFPTLYYRTQVLELATLSPRHILTVTYSPSSVAFSPDGSRALISSIHARGYGELQDFDLATGQATAAMGVAGVFGLGAAFPPLPPTLEATVSGQRVTLSWSLPAHSPAAQRFVIHVGSRSGASDLGTVDVGAGVSFFSVPGVPAGRYFLRMTAVNVTGTSLPSAEVIVDVPTP